MHVRLIVDLPNGIEELDGLDTEQIQDRVTDALIEALDTPLVAVISAVDENDEAAWLRSENF